MCGIMGYIGKQAAVPVLLSGLQKLEYRGYDSSGIAILEENQLKIYKKIGKLTNLKQSIEQEKLSSSVGIGHTRWATHGRPSDQNAHPHADCHQQFAVVHNGIIENYLTLKQDLIARGHKFLSETDTEVLAHLLEEAYAGDLLAAVQKVISQIEGSYALVVLSRENPNQLVAARQNSPLIVGLGKDENFLASDIPAILAYTRQICILNDGEIVRITPEQVEIFDANGHPVQREIFEVKWEASQAEKGGYAHFMLKEIFEQPKALQDTLRGRINGQEVVLPEIDFDLQDITNIQIVACGTAYHAGLVGRQIIEKLTQIPVKVEVASEFRYSDPLIDAQTLTIVISQSGETADTLAAMREAQAKGSRAIAITNVVDSTIAREADSALYTWAGPEIAVASTKAYTTQLMLIYLLAIYLAQQKGRKNPELLQELRQISTKVELILKDVSHIQDLVQRYAHIEDAFFIGRGLDHVVAQEGSLKLKEISYIHAEAYAAGELKHGTLALIVEGVLVIALVTQQALYDKTLSNIKEVKAREAFVLALAQEGHSEVEKVVDEVIYIPAVDSLLTPILTVIPLQLLAYYMAVAKGSDVDQPRNLAKSVTVE